MHLTRDRQGGGTRQRFWTLLTPRERERVRSIQNGVIAGAEQPTVETVPWANEAWYVKAFEPITVPYDQHRGIWFPYVTSEDIKKWAALLHEALPGMLHRFLEADSAP